jgi:hypothetical protein
MQPIETTVKQAGPEWSTVRFFDKVRTPWAAETAIISQWLGDFSCEPDGSPGMGWYVMAPNSMKPPWRWTSTADRLTSPSWLSWKAAGTNEHERVQSDLSCWWERFPPLWPCTKVEDATDAVNNIDAASIHRRAFSTETFLIIVPARRAMGHTTACAWGMSFNYNRQFRLGQYSQVCGFLPLCR